LFLLWKTAIPLFWFERSSVGVGLFLNAAAKLLNKFTNETLANALENLAQHSGPICISILIFDLQFPILNSTE
jgi:hypothetical protein